MQKFNTIPNDSGKFDVARWNDVTQQYEIVERGYLTQEEAKKRAKELCSDYKKECQREYEEQHQNELISKYHGYAVSDDIQKRNAAREFFERFPFQRDVCDTILKKMDE